MNPLAIVMEFAPLDSLHEFLVKVKEEVRCLLVVSIQTYFVSYHQSHPLLAEWKSSYIAGMGVVHHDLDSRNVHMAVDKYLKITNFGLFCETKELYVFHLHCYTELPYITDGSRSTDQPILL